VARQAPCPLLIFPCNGNGVEALDALADAYRLVGFVDDTPAKQGTTVHGHAVLPRQALRDWPDAQVLAVPGSPVSYLGRRALIDGLNVAAARWAQLVHPSARVSPLARIGRNVLIMAGVVITSDAVIGDHVCVLPNTVLHHGARVGDWSLVGANVTVAGDTAIGANCYIGSGSSLMNGLTIGDGALVGLGSVVLRDVAAGTRVAGCPARALR
jgi:sugar O-acyltransferase (sialic acid O-acetyltransferase NeuD family)